MLQNRSALVLAVLCSGWLCGCAALHPLKGIPASYVPPEFQQPSRSGKQTIDLSLLSQTKPLTYRLDTGDTLGIYVEGILGRREEVPPVHFPAEQDLPPSMGYPIPVRDDGTISLPLIPPIQVRGITVRELEERIRRAYTVDQQILQPGRDRILVSLQRPRTHQVLVIRQEDGVGIAGAGLNLGALKRGTGQVVALPAYKNDVLHALAETNGLPGLDAENAIYIIRARKSAAECPPVGLPHPLPAPPAVPVPPRKPEQEPNFFPTGIQQTSAEMVQAPATGWGHTQFQAPEPQFPGYGDPTVPYGPGPQFTPGMPMHAPPGTEMPLSQHSPVPGPWQEVPEGHSPLSMYPNHPAFQAYGNPATVEGPEIVKIPVRLAPGEQPTFTEEDILLYEGDIVFIESRETEIFYTGGLLGGGQYTLPRDYDLDILGAIAIAQRGTMGGLGASAAGPSALNQDVTISASQVVILRPLPNGSQVPIKVDLYKAVRNPQERIIIQPGDYIILQYTPVEAVAAFFERHLLEGALLGFAAGGWNGRNN